MKISYDAGVAMPAEYDFSRGMRGKYARQYARGANVVVLAPDVAKIFTSTEAVNRSLRALADILRRQKKPSSPNNLPCSNEPGQ